MACLYGPSALILPPDIQMALYHGRTYAKAYKQELHWDTCQERSKEALLETYTVLRGHDIAVQIVSTVDRMEKEAEAKRRLEEVSGSSYS